MTRRIELLALAERVEKGETGPLLSDACWTAAGWEDKGGYWQKPNSRDSVHGGRPDLTTSIDAQAALPARIVSVTRWPQGFVAEVAVEPALYGTRDPDDHFVGRAKTEPAARLAALLRAMAEGGE